MTEDLLDRLEAAAPTLDRAIFDPPAPAARSTRRTRSVLVAAALLVTVTGGIVALATTIGRNADDSTPPQVATAPPDDGSSGSTPPPAPAFDVPRPEQLAVLDEALGAGAPALYDPQIAWLYADGDVALFVRYDDSGAPAAALQVADWSAHEWDKSFNDGRPIDLDGVPARVMNDAARPTVGWQYDRGVRTVVGTGAIDEAEVIAAATAFAATGAGDDGLNAPAGYVAQSLPASSWSVVYPDGVNVVIRTAAPGEHLDARARAFVEHGNASPNADASAWLAELVWDGQVQSRAGYIDLDERTQVSVHIPVEGSFDGRFDVSSALASIRLVDGDSVPVQDQSAPAETVLIAGGESVAGRWLLSEWQWHFNDSECIELRVSHGQGVWGCDDWLAPCYFEEMVAMERTWSWAALVPGTGGSVVVTVNGRTIPIDVRWPAGDYTVVSGSRPLATGFGDWGEQRLVEILVDGTSCTDLPTG